MRRFSLCLREWPPAIVLPATNSCCLRVAARLHGDEFLRDSPLRGRRGSAEYRSSTWLGQRSRSPSPSRAGAGAERHYGGARSASPAASAQSLPAQRRRLPPTPAKPSRLRLDARSMEAGINFPSVSQSPTLPGARSPAAINFPKVNASPTHCPRQLPSPLLPNGVKEVALDTYGDRDRRKEMPPSTSIEDKSINLIASTMLSNFVVVLL
ncbi:hypothetical protein HPB49_010732 [Dermacentor silvarum]|uniref:Uncharacterized protein n=1 Tax=Dermacentor silvarum TaxID=543639 RepID=A0ACB8DYM4_DERSI|nr:hypothetical protein HPB49_010732 [Dermacentor silvarum]